MMYFMKPLPEGEIDTSDWSPFIKNQWFRGSFMYFVYGLQGILLVCSFLFGAWRSLDSFQKTYLFLLVYIIHEILHLIVIYTAGDVSITHSGIFFWITSGAVLGKLRFFIFMFLPFFSLTAVPAAAYVFLPGELRDMAAYAAWINSVIAGADIINSVLIALKPKGSLFYRGYYKVLKKVTV